MGRSSTTERLVSTVRQFNGGRWIEKGEAFDADEREVAVQIRNHWARRDERAAPTAGDSPAPRRGRYQRRDMQAEE
jgi:hypothetical protein